ncbi:curli assembly protein CsgF [Shewanella sp. C32]|uniref:Curli production assembly/transport component CsgF n=1 Tax=Shewanella electrica TaxID=515560 RepID=A0ABT2FFI7_9GAMM|nr:curli assembly protein CsgF [Shewanella electrica]MCH1925142.1 curli assembly protein CsgF [Shewanella electrica]MCS4554966.1 curli assembly protein CsgF [Shewanella electrica]
MKAFLFTLIFLSMSAPATELVYTPVNPSFGGNSLNANFLLSKAQSQNNHTDDSNELGFEDQFRAALERNIINSLTRRISDGELVEGTYNTGDYQIDVAGADGTGVTVTITNLSTGEITIITMPSMG